MNIKDNNIEIAEIGEVRHNGYIPEDIPSYKQDDMKDLIFGKSYKVLDISLQTYYIWYRIEENEYKLWYPSISFVPSLREFIKKKYYLK